MRAHWIFRFAVLSAVTSFAQSLQLRGKVFKGVDTPLANAIVTVVGAGFKDTTDAQGAYAFNQNFAAIKPAQHLTRYSTISLAQSEMRFRALQPTTVSVEAFDVQGHLVETLTKSLAFAGEYRLDVSQWVRGSQLTLIRAKVGNDVALFRYQPALGFRQQGNATFDDIGSPDANLVLAKQSASVDSLKVEAAGYVTKKVGIAAYDATVDVTLEKQATGLAEFSFFITSQQGLFKLAKTFSGSDKGFGGDLRYGQTGAGAGLKGADKICEDLAESSMPGAKAKGWRAFLSAVADESGKQANAIDRIGTGPWYDRLGRLIATDKAGLLVTRPAGDAEVTSDLPNEFGVPNHRPDPTLPEVDNHLTMTGTSNQGLLYGPNSTCDDWTSTSKTPGPRVGMSWPQAGGMPLKNWISEWDQAGCEAGFDLDPKTGAGTKGDLSVGKGGGYGGYYCFALTP